MWEVKFIQDTEIEGIGTVIASNDGFEYSQRIDTNNEKEIIKFVLEVNENFNNIINKKDNSITIQKKILSYLNK